MQLLLADIAAVVPGASEQGIAASVLWACQRFCRRSQVWAQHRTGVLGPDLAVEGMPIPQAMPFNVTSIVISGRYVPSASEVFISSNIATQVYAQVDFVGSPTYERIVAPAGSSPGEAVEWVTSFYPLSLDSFPPLLVNMYRDVLWNGAIAHLKSQPSMPFYDFQGARAHGYAFESGSRNSGISRASPHDRSAGLFAPLRKPSSR